MDQKLHMMRSWWMQDALTVLAPTLLVLAGLGVYFNEWGLEWLEQVIVTILLF